jgi:formylglycine-generating enzyme required for sulfatase activity
MLLSSLLAAIATLPVVALASGEVAHQERWIPGGTFAMGSSNHYPDEAPVQVRSVRGFWMDTHEVTNAMFAEFVAATGYVTTSEKEPLQVEELSATYAALKPGSAVFVMPAGLITGTLTDWWKYVPGANWRTPEGPGSDLDGRDDHPVVHITMGDAKAFADWAGRALATETEWEYAASVDPQKQTLVSHNGQASYPVQSANVWQGLFPLRDSAVDGFAGTAPVASYSANRAGLHDMVGNVWEWVDTAYVGDHAVGTELDVTKVPGSPQRKTTAAVDGPYLPRSVIKGGSFLCAEDFCARFRPSARLGQEANFGSSHIGFRTVRRP